MRFLPVTLPFALAVAAISGCAKAEANQIAPLDRSAVQFLAAMASDADAAKAMVNAISRMELQSGVGQPADWNVYRSEFAKYKLNRIDIRDDDEALITLTGVSSAKANSPCYDVLYVWLYRKDQKLDLNYSVDQKARCVQPVQTIPLTERN